MRHNYTEARLAGKDQSHLHLGHLNLFMKHFWALVPVNAPSNTEHFYTDTARVGHLRTNMSFRQLSTLQIYALCSRMYFTFSIFVMTMHSRLAQTSQGFYIKFIFSQSSPWPDSSETCTSFGVAKSRQGNR